MEIKRMILARYVDFDVTPTSMYISSLQFIQFIVLLVFKRFYSILTKYASTTLTYRNTGHNVPRLCVMYDLF